MATNIDIDSDQIKIASATLEKAVGDIPQRLSQLLASVNSLLGTPEGGLFLSQSSPAFQHAYANFNTSLNQAVLGIDSFRKQFEGIANSIIGMDDAITKAINGSK